MFHSNSLQEHTDRQALLIQIPNTKMELTPEAHERIMIPQQQNSLFYIKYSLGISSQCQAPLHAGKMRFNL